MVFGAKKNLLKLKKETLSNQLVRAKNLQVLVGNEQETRLINLLDQKRIAAECAVWLRNKVEIKASQLPQSAQNLIHLQSHQRTLPYTEVQPYHLLDWVMSVATICK